MTTQLMDSIGVVEPVRSETSKRLSEDGELGVRCVKKAKLGDRVKKVAEIVLVLATMGKIRGGELPSVVEMEMMEDAKAKLVEVSEQFAPKDVFPTQVFGSIIEDLGLDCSREHKSGFQPPKVSIGQKLNLTKQKMENSEKYAPQSANYISQTAEPNIRSSVLVHSGVQTFSLEKPSPVPSSLGWQPASASGPVSAANSTSLPYQLPTSEVRPPVSSGLPNSNIGNHTSALALPRAERPYYTLNGKSNGVSYTSQVQVQSQASSSAAFHASIKGGATGVSKMASQATISRPFITQTTSVNPLGVHQHIQPGARFVNSPSQGNSHDEIGKIVQNLLQQQIPKHPIWTPPSRDYMNKALPCQICKLVISEVDNVLVCDACEKGYHLNCIQMLNPKSLPKAEWQCRKCFSLSGGKPLPPKYGRVTRNSTALKVSSPATEVHLSVYKNVGVIDVKDNLKGTAISVNSGRQSAPQGASEKSNHSSATAQMGDGRIMHGNGATSTEGMANLEVMQRNGSLSSNGEKAGEHLSEPVANNLVVTLGASSFTHDDHKVERLTEDKIDPNCNSQPSAKSVAVGRTFNDSQISGHNKDYDQIELTNRSEIPSKQCAETNVKVLKLGKSCGEDFLEQNAHDDANKDNHGVSVINHDETTETCIGAKEHDESLSDGLHEVGWIGDKMQVMDGKTYYQSYSMSGVLYKVQDHALFRINNVLTPFKLQGMWEDSKTRSKWVVASRCYFPADLPEGVGRPCSPDMNEVYESNHDTILSAGLIQGLCEVLPSRTFMDETERRTHLGMGGSDNLRPLYICKWFYDEKRELFRAVTG